MSSDGAARGSRKSRVAGALAVFAILLSIYAYTAAPSVLYGDSGEFQTVALVGGIPHSTGYPAFLLAGWAFGKLPFADPAFRINFLSAFFGAAALAVFVLFASELGAGALAAAVAALMYGLTYTMWRVSLRAEVYTVAILLGVLAFGWTLVALRSGRVRDALVAALLLGLSLVGHLCFAAPVLVLGLALAWRVFRSVERPLGPLVLLAVAFVLGLTPYLAIPWLDGRELPLDYFTQVVQVKNPLGLPMPDFDTPWERLWWMITGRNMYPPVPGGFGPRDTAVHLVESGVMLVLFELGLVATALALAGARRAWRVNRRGTWSLGLALVASVVYSARYQTGAILELFLIPAVLVLAWFVAAGVQTLFDALARRRPGAGAWTRVAVGAALLAAVVLPNQLVRLWTNAHPIGPRRWSIQEEDMQIAPRGFFPGMRGFDRPKRFGETVSAAIPRDALVLAGWPEFNILRYRTLALGDRPDLTLQLMTPESLPIRLALWQREHDPRTRPFVFLHKVPEMERHYAALDSIPIGEGRFLYVQRDSLANPPEL
jgi:hypothetical protein